MKRNYADWIMLIISIVNYAILLLLGTIYIFGTSGDSPAGILAVVAVFIFCPIGFFILSRSNFRKFNLKFYGFSLLSYVFGFLIIYLLEVTGVLV